MFGVSWVQIWTFYFFHHCAHTCCVSLPTLPREGSRALTAGQPHLQFQMKLWSSKFLHLPGQPDLQLPQLTSGERESGLCFLSHPSTLVLFLSSFSPRDASGFSRFGKVKMDERNGLVLFSLNYSMSSVWERPKIQMSVKTTIWNSLLDCFTIKKDRMNMVFYFKKSGE